MKKKIIGYNPITAQPVYEGEKNNTTCGDCGKKNCLTLHYQNEYGFLKHGVCFSCWGITDIEELKYIS